MLGRLSAVVWGRYRVCRRSVDRRQVAVPATLDRIPPAGRRVLRNLVRRLPSRLRYLVGFPRRGKAKSAPALPVSFCIRGAACQQAASSFLTVSVSRDFDTNDPIYSKHSE